MLINLDRETIYQAIIIVLFILLDRILNTQSIVNNGNILTDGKWKCYREMGKNNVGD